MMLTFIFLTDAANKDHKKLIFMFDINVFFIQIRQWFGFIFVGCPRNSNRILMTCACNISMGYVCRTVYWHKYTNNNFGLYGFIFLRQTNCIYEIRQQNNSMLYTTHECNGVLILLLLLYKQHECSGFSSSFNRDVYRILEVQGNDVSYDADSIILLSGTAKQ